MPHPSPTASLPARTLRLLAAAAVLACSFAAPAQTVQEHVHGHGHEVMPFDLGKTVHIFRMTEDGGIQQVVVRGDAADPEQVRMIQHHLALEASDFQQGNFADPGHLHGPAMPGLRELEQGARRMQITYRPLPNGGEIRFRAKDIKLVTAVHRWFGAQLSEHGADARSE
ncbi:aspartate carbamoyltransferase [Ramlibacter ginsenosidimutans]|uniref:Aspartate carbamoyltransferase n=1 Tax=Ramlibacter ginsenosidimutans TaxID=502333 RepID=A0A934TZR2_9BURK|nr:aspartate carbamoyltransferase [Ramlibacter ginsenosidimutans]MBK6009207.1 aspartate carbamoyltransferase [Ramlibacter ginsenosidimutans]